MLNPRDYQTPNAIDPGERPPSRPARRAPEQTNDDVRRNAARLLDEADNRSISSRTPITMNSFPYDAEDLRSQGHMGGGGGGVKGEYDDDEPVHDQLPSVEEARLYAGRILSARSRRDLMVGGEDSSESERVRLTNTVPITTPVVVKEARERRNLCCRYYCMTLAILCVISISIAVLVGGRRRFGSASFPSSAPHLAPEVTSDRLEQALGFLTSNGISAPDAFLERNSPQFEAAMWVADRDLLQYKIPSSLEDKSTRFLQRYILVVFYLSLRGPEWRNQMEFLDKTDECAWFRREELTDGSTVAVGVTCTEDDAVETILMPRNLLRGQLPSELAYLSRLDFLDVNRNLISGTIPTEYKRLTRLDFIDLRYNFLTGTLPAWIGDSLSNLVLLGLSNNQFDGTIPLSYARLSELKTVALDDNRLKGSISVFNALRNLEFVYLDRNKFDSRLDDSSFALSLNLQHLDLSGNELTAKNIPAHFFQYPEMSVLDLGDNAITGSFPADLPANTALKYLALNDNVIRSEIPETIGQLRNLEHLDLTDNIFFGDLPLSLQSLSQLTYLFLGENDFTKGPVPTFLGNMVELRELSLGNIQRTGSIPTSLEGLTNLILLDLGANELLGSVPSFLWSLSNLSYLLLQRNKFSGQLPPGVDNVSNLRLFLLDKNDLVGSTEEVCNDLPNIKFLVADCEEISCTCCTDCCSDGEPDKCSDDKLYATLDGSWEHNYTRVSYTFSPAILLDAN